MKSGNIFMAALLLSASAMAVSAAQPGETINPGDNISLRKLCDGIYIHTTTDHIEGYGDVSSNGLIVFDGQDALLVDTPATPQSTARLTALVEKELGRRFTMFVPTHWHSDCMGGIDHIHEQGARSIALKATEGFAREHGLTLPHDTFEDHIWLTVGSRKVLCWWPGPGHTPDNIVVWIPGERILFGGCLIKDINATSLGNTADADTQGWPRSVENLLDAFPEAVTVIPGHGPSGGTELIRHTLTLF